MTTLDVTTLPDTFEYQHFQLADLIDTIKPTVEFWSELGVVRKVDSFGFAVSITSPNLEVTEDHWDHPESYVTFVGGWGEERDRYIANAVRKMRASIRTGLDTLHMVGGGSEFREIVASQAEDGSFAWGDFPYGGATFVNFGNYEILVAVSALTQEEDDLVAGFIGKLIGNAMYIAEP
jgi:hypothetical protein